MKDTLGPVSAALAADLQELARQHGFVLWPDRPGDFTDFVDRLVFRRDAGELPFDIVAHRGSFLELMFELEPRAGGLAKRPLVVHLPGLDESAARDTPLLELLCVGHCFRKPLRDVVADAATGKVPADQLAELTADDDLTLHEADAWLELRLAGQQAGDLGRLHAVRLPDVVDDLLRPRGVFTTLAGERDGPLWSYLSARAGVTAAWRDACIPGDTVRAEDLAFAVTSWALCVEYVHDLKHREPSDERLRAMDALPRAVVAACRELADHLRARPDEFYRRTADETERRFEAEAREANAEDLGDIDTFRFEEDKVLLAALDALAADAWDAAARWAELRLRGPSFWLRVDPPRQLAWELVRDVAALSRALAAAGPRLAAGSLDEAVSRYTTHGAAVDRAHRHLERRRGTVATTTPYFERLRTCLDSARDRWLAWADAWAHDFNAACRTHGFLPAPALQQRTLFDDIVLRMTREPGTTALFVVDALRYEMAEELFATFDAGAATTAHLRARLAELPTVTEVGMNVLAPVAAPGGRLRPTVDGRKIKGFRTGEYTVHDPETRQRAMRDRADGTRCPWITLDEIVARTPDSLRQAIRGANLVVVHSREIDDLGEADTAFVSLASFDVVIHRLRAAWALLREAGVRRFVITADHGFLLLSEPTRTPHGRKIDPRQRCTIVTSPNNPRAVHVALADLKYDDTTHHLLVPAGTDVFDTAMRPSFVHGGNSLQERVIPVITLEHRAGAGGSQVRYTVAVEPREGVMDMHCLKIRVDPSDAQASLDYAGFGELELALRVPEAPEVAVDLRSVRGARLAHGVIVAPVGRDFELFFHLRGPNDARVLVELFHPTAVAEVYPCVAPDRYAVLAVEAPAPPPAAPEPTPQPPRPQPPNQAATPPVAESTPRQAPPTPSWLDALPEGGVRRVFAHLAEHGKISENDARTILGKHGYGQFTLKYKEYAAKAPFAVRIDTSDNVKTYLREGAAT
ncbi:MAG: BREX-6 system phosphatase PglZ [Myxococcales bacterium]|nr:BREX-6 system phosphatase PglZ [Myxococcales bacterium]